jgi:ABC-type multidrug transport system permease subunit
MSIIIFSLSYIFLSFYDNMMPFLFFLLFPILTFLDTILTSKKMLLRSIFLLLIFTTMISSNEFYDNWKNKFKNVKTKAKDIVTEKIQEKCKCKLNKSLKSIINYKHVSCRVYSSLSS